jgi:uncharacterized protein (DUF488 family)
VPMPQANRLNLPSASIKKQLENKGFWNECRSAKNADFFTIGYTGKKTAEIIASLREFDVRTLVDIRQNPVSMYRPELSKRNLRDLLAQHGVDYVHLPELGVPRDIRAKAIETGTRDVIWDWYDENVITSFVGSNLHFFFNAFEHPIALMCTEIDPQECHRHRLCLALEQKGMRGFDL